MGRAELECVELERLQLERVELERLQLERVELERLQLERLQLERLQLERVGVGVSRVATRRDPSAAVGLLITVVAIAASLALAVGAPAGLATIFDNPRDFLFLLALTLALQLFSSDLYGSGGESVSAAGMLAAAFVLGAAPAMAIAIVAAVLQWIRRRGLLHRAIFDASDFALATGAAAVTYAVADQATDSIPVLLAAAAAAGVAYKVVNTGLLCVAMALSESVPVREVWRERFRWARFHYLALGPVAFAAVVAYERMGVLGLAAFSVPPVLMMLSVREYVERTRESVETVRSANEELRRSNAELAARNDDLRELLGFTGGLAAHAHDRRELTAYAEEALGRLVGASATIADEAEPGSHDVAVGATAIAHLRLDRGPRFDGGRWDRLRDALVPQLATALESAVLVERVRKTHLQTIAALSRSMEAKDGCTEAHTERVAAIAVALGRQLGYFGPDLDAVEVGALLHDIGKIGIPERILNKPGPLDDEEWRVMKQHPLISDYILSGIDLHPIVLEIARSTHERIDGRGYPDGLAGDEIPLPARIVLVADAWDALTSDRPYRLGSHPRVALEEVRTNVATQFCPVVVRALEELYRSEPALLGAGLQAVA
jgi:putative nucleotidyltransferase with HDIG domain